MNALKEGALTWPSLPEHPPITRRQQFGLRDEIKEAKDEEKKNKKQQAVEEKEVENEKNGGKQCAAKKRAAKKCAATEAPEKPPAKVIKSASMKNPKKIKKSPAGKKLRGLRKQKTMAQSGWEPLEQPPLEDGVDVEEEEAEEEYEQDSQPPKECAADSAERESKGDEMASSSKGPILRKKNSGKNKKGKNSRKKAAKVEDGKRAAKEKSSKPAKGESEGVQELPDFAYWYACITQMVEECCDTDCLHPDAGEERCPPNFQVSCYWTRHAAGVKASNAILQDLKTGKKNKKAARAAKPKSQQKVYKSKDFRQVAYFSHGGCVYVNVKLASLFALWLHAGETYSRLCMRACVCIYRN